MLTLVIEVASVTPGVRSENLKELWKISRVGQLRGLIRHSNQTGGTYIERLRDHLRGEFKMASCEEISVTKYGMIMC